MERKLSYLVATGTTQHWGDDLLSNMTLKQMQSCHHFCVFFSFFLLNYNVALLCVSQQAATKKVMFSLPDWVTRSFWLPPPRTTKSLTIYGQYRFQKPGHDMILPSQQPTNKRTKKKQKQKNRSTGKIKTQEIYLQFD